MTWSWQGDGTVILVAMLAGCACALVGSYLVLRRMSLMGDAISHAVLPGLVIAFLITHSRGIGAMLIGAVVVGILTALLTQMVARYGKVEEGAAMGVVFTILFAIGLVLIRRATDHVDLDPSCVLYGNIAHIYADAFHGTPVALKNLAIVFALNLVFVVAFYKELKVSAFDPGLSSTLGINANLMHYALMILVALTAVVSFEAVGSILVIAMLIVPPVTAYLLTDRLGIMLLLSVVFSGLAAVMSHLAVIAFPVWFNTPIQPDTSAMMTVFAGLFLAVAIVVAPRRGLASQAWQHMALRLQIRREDILGILYRFQEHLGDETAAAMPTEELRRIFGHGPLTSYALRSLRRRRLTVKIGGSSLALTEKGLHRAERLIRSHRLWETYVAQHSDLPLDHLHEPAERVEHFIGPRLETALREEVADPQADPHGRSIPSGHPEKND